MPVKSKLGTVCCHYNNYLVVSLALPRRKGKLLDLWTYQTVALADKISRLALIAARDEAGLNLSQWRVLAALADKPKRTAAEVVSVTPMDKGVVSRSLDTLINSGLVKKMPDKNDRRRSSLSLTHSGRKTYQLIANRIERDYETVAEANVNTSELVKTLSKINDLLSPQS